LESSSLAWADGLFEGEGNAKVYLAHVSQFNKTDGRLVRYPSRRPAIQVANTDISLLSKFRVIVGVGTVRIARRADNKSKLLFHHRVECRKADRVARLLLPFIVSDYKRRQLKAITEYYDNFAPNRHQAESSKRVWARYTLEQRRQRGLAISNGRRRSIEWPKTL
jgi:hypothetical protein